MLEVVKLNVILRQRTHWEKYERDDLSQCARCQAIGHVTRGCLGLDRCVRCVGNHRSQDCPEPKKTEGGPKAYCHNYKTMGHPASYKGCPARKLIVTKIRKQQQEKLARQPALISKAEDSRELVTQGVTYAARMRRDQQQDQQ